MKGLLWGILFIILIGIGGFVYRNAAEHPYQPIVCPIDAEICPDGTALSRTGASCTFPACPPPNVSTTLGNTQVVYAAPADFAAAAAPDAASFAAYALATASSSAASTTSIVLRYYPVGASSTPVTIINQTALDASGNPVAATAFSSTILGNRRYTVAAIEHSYKIIDTAYYLTHEDSVFRFDAIDAAGSRARPAHDALMKLLATMQMQ